MRPSVWLCLLLGLGAAASGLEERWHYDMVSSARSLPLAVDCNGDGTLEVVVTTRFDGTVWVVGADGALVHRWTRDQWLEGSVASGLPLGAKSPVLAYQESAGRLNLAHYTKKLNLWVDLEGEACIGTAPCFADLDGDGSPELLCARRNGIVSALDAQLNPRWQFDAASPFDSSPAVAPIFEDTSAVYVQATDGTLHCLNGDGLALWRFHTAHRAPRFPSVADPVVARLTRDGPSVLVSDTEGWLYAVRAADGNEQWRVRVGTTALGSPAIVDALPIEGLEVVTVDQAGQVTVLSGMGAAIQNGTLPEARYVPRPLVADVDGDGSPEILLANRDWAIVVAALDGTVEESIKLQGSATEGIILADLDGDALLELVAATECGRIYCFATQAKALANAGAAWTHPRANAALSGCAPPIAPVGAAPRPAEGRKRLHVKAVVLPAPAAKATFASAVVQLKNLPKATEVWHVTAAIRQGDAIVGSAAKPLEAGWFVMPLVRVSEDELTLDVALHAGEDRAPRAGIRGYRFQPAPPEPFEPAPPDAFLEALAERGDAFQISPGWDLPTIGGRDTWHVVRFKSDGWRTFGLDKMPFIKEAIPRVWASAKSEESIFTPKNPAWPALEADTKPFFLMNDYFRPEVKYPDDVYQAIVAMAGEAPCRRFLGFPVHEWAYRVWKTQLEDAETPPSTREAATAILKNDFEYLLDMCHGRIYQGQGYCLFQHHAFEWGAPMGYAEVGENIPCASHQFAFLRGASRQYGGRPWGAYLSNWFRGTVLDSRYRPADAPRIKWSPPDMASGPDCGHSPSLEFRLEMAAHFAGATLIHHESDAHHDSVFVQEEEPGSYKLSLFGKAMASWYEYARRYPDRGVPYTPIALMLDFHHGWRPREYIYGVWPQQRPDRSIDGLFRHVYAWGGRLDFERGYLANGPYGDIFDVLVTTATPQTLDDYGVIWPIGELTRGESVGQVLVEYVANGGIVVLDSALARSFPSPLLGVQFGKDVAFATRIQTALGDTEPLTAPYRYRPMDVAPTARVLAWTEAGAPILAWQPCGQGMFIVAATDHWVDERERLLPLVGAILNTLADAFLPVRPLTDIQMFLSRTREGWIVGLINNDGVTKVPTLPARVDPKAARDCVLRFRGKAPIEFTSRRGEFRWSNRADGLYTRVGPGGVVIVETKFSSR